MPPWFVGDQLTRLDQMTRRLPSTIRLCHRAFSTADPPPSKAPAAGNGETEVPVEPGAEKGQFDVFTRKRTPSTNPITTSTNSTTTTTTTGKRQLGRSGQQYMAALKSGLSALPGGQPPNPLHGPTNDLFPDLRPSLLLQPENPVDLGCPDAFPYPLDGVQVEEVRAVCRGFLAQPSSLPRVLALTYAEAMGEGMLERVAMGLARDSGADCLTFHARDFGGMLEGCARSWYGRPYFAPSVSKSVTRVLDEDDLELAPGEEDDRKWIASTDKSSDRSSDMSNDRRLSSSSGDKWLSHFLKRQPVKKTSQLQQPNNAAHMDAKIKETVNLYSVLTFLSQCMDRAGCQQRPRLIHLSGFGASLANPLHRSHLLRFAQEANSAGRTCLVLVSESNPKADNVPLDDQSSSSSPTTTTTSSTTSMPLGLASYLLTKGRCERLAEIPNTPEYDANWLLDRSAFGGLRLFLVPPRDPARRAQLHALLDAEHRERVRAFNVRRLSDVLEQLGIAQEGPLLASDAMGLERSPLLLSEAIYLAYMAAAEGRAVTRDSIQAALQRYTETRALHKAHYAPPALPSAQQHLRLDVKALSKYEKRLLPCIVTAGTAKGGRDQILTYACRHGQDALRGRRLP